MAQPPRCAIRRWLFPLPTLDRAAARPPAPHMIYLRLNKAPPIAARPRCANCARAMRPYWHTVKTERTERQGKHGTIYDWTATAEWRGDYHGKGPFCKLACAHDFAILAHRAGYRRKAAPTTTTEREI